MSEFFKALEQAERDRARENQDEAQKASAAARIAPHENGTPPAEHPIAEPVVARQAVSTPEVEEAIRRLVPWFAARRSKSAA